MIVRPDRVIIYAFVTRNLQTTMTLKEKIVADLTEAMKAKEADRVSTLRMVKANLMNRQIEKGGELTDEEVTKALQSLVKQRRDSIEQYETAGRPELAARQPAPPPLRRECRGHRGTAPWRRWRRP